MNRANLFHYATGEKYRQDSSIDQTFKRIHEDSDWDINHETPTSGNGATLEQTKIIIGTLPKLVKKYHIKSILDLPCGDFNWMRNVKWEADFQYFGGDIVENLVNKHQKEFGNKNRTFLHLDMTKDEVPKTDLIFSRDCWVHLSFEHIFQAISNLKKNGNTYLLTTTFPEEAQNSDIITGGWRPLNFEKPPFNFPKPIELINENCTEMNGAFTDKSLGLWRISDL